MKTFLLAAALGAAALAAPEARAATFPTLSGAAPLVIGHRGASGYLPEHTLAAYELAIRMGADYIEPDLQLTADGHLVAVHDETLTRTTNVAELFAPRNGGYRVEDFTLAEIKTLSTKPTGTAQDSFPGFTPSAPNAFEVPTFAEVLAFLNDWNAANGTRIGVYPEAKTPNRAAMNERIVAELKAAGFGAAEDPVFIQSFSFQALRDIRDLQAAEGMALRQVALGGAVEAGGVFGIFEFGANLFHPLASVTGFAQGLGVFIGPFAGQALSADWIAAAHAIGLEVHGWTFRHTTLEQARALTLPFIAMGMDGFFTDYPDLTRAVVTEATPVAPPAPVPLPPAGALLAAALGALALRRRR